MAKDDGRPKCRTCNAPVAPGAGQEVSRWIDSKPKTYGSNPKNAAQARRLRANNDARRGR